MSGMCFGRADVNKLKSLLSRCDLKALDTLTACIGADGFFYYACRMDDENKELFPANYAASILKRTGITAIKNSILKENLLEISAAFSENGIEFIVLKGIPMVERVYHDLSYRAVSDIDILIKKEQYGKAAQLLESMGYFHPTAAMQKLSKSYSKEWAEQEMREIAYEKNALPFPITVDLHQDINLFINSDYMNSLYPMKELDWFAQVTQIELGGQKIPCLSNEFEFLFLVFHFSVQHSFIGMKWLIDICQIIEKSEDKLDWEKIDQAVTNPNMRKLIGLCIVMARRYIGESKPSAQVITRFADKKLSARRYGVFFDLIFEEFSSTKAKVFRRLLKVTMPVAFGDKLGVLMYYLFNKGTIKNRTQFDADNIPRILMPFVLLKIVVSDIRKAKKKKREC